LNRKSVFGWCLFDFANSSYSAVIAAVVFPVYYAKVIVGNEAGLGDLWWGRAISLSMAIVALSSPFLGGIADSSGARKRFLFFYTLVCAVSVASFSILQPGMIMAGFFLIVLANIGMEGGLVFYNAYLPDVSPPDHIGRVSAWGFGVGYAGSLASLLLALPLVKSGMFQAVWVMVGIFFMTFSLPLFLWVNGGGPAGAEQHGGEGVLSAASHGLRSMTASLREIWGHSRARRFLSAYFIYEDGVNTVIVFSSIFAATTLGFRAEELILLYLVVQVTALGGSFAMAAPIDRWGAKRVIMLSLALWALVSVIACLTHTKQVFWMVAAIAGLGLGTVQAASRAMFAGFIPKGREAAFFGVYSLVGKTSAVLGPLVFGYVSAMAGSQRPAILSVALFFLAGGVLLSRVEAS